MLWRLIPAVIAVLGIWGGILTYLAQEQSQVLKSTERDSQNLSKAFEENIRRTIDVVDTSIRAMRVARSHDPNHFNLVDWDRESSLSRELTLQISYTDSAGTIVGSNLDSGASRISIADRPHFIATKALLDDRLFISDPVIGRVSGRWSVQFVRKLLDSAGGFEGVCVASLDPRFLARFYASLDIGDGLLIVLGSNGIIKAGASRREITPGGSVAGTALQAGIGLKPIGTVAGNDLLDGLSRVYSWRRVEPYDLVVAVGLSRQDALAEHDSHVRAGFALGLGMTALVLIVVMVLQRHRRVAERSQAVLVAAVANINQGLLVVDANRRFRC